MRKVFWAGAAAPESELLNMRQPLFALSLALLFVITTLPLRAADPVRSLAPVYRHWIEEEVPYVISTTERKAFLLLHSDLERDNYINAFWEARNPNPGQPFNAYKEEHYRRLAYANETFGSARYQDGWRTDMGRMYITLGPPKFRTPYHLTANIRDLEIWFYQGETPALPPFFNILFFRPGAGEDYKIYSPRNDGPFRLVTTGRQDNMAGLRVIRQQLGPEAAHIALSLIPSEPVDLDSGQPSMTSDLMLNTIRNLADSPIERDRIIRSRSREAAVSSVIVPGGPNEVDTTIYRDSRGRLTMSYLLRNHKPDPALLGRRKDGANGYSLGLRTSLFTSSGMLIYEQEGILEGVLTEAQMTAARSRGFGAEDRVPIVPGTYNLEILVRNNRTSEATISRQSLVVPEISAMQLSLSNLEVYGQPSPVRDPAGTLPFSVAGLRFAPRSTRTATIHVGDKLPVVFQLRLPTPTAAAPRPATVRVQYVFGALSAAGRTPTTTEEDISTDNADGAGNLLSGHTLDTSDLAVGTYRVVVHATGVPGTASASSSLQLHVLPMDAPIDVWTAYGPEPLQSTSADDLKRGLAAQALDRWDDAVIWYESCLREFPDEPRSLRHLAAALSHLGRNPQLAAIADRPQMAKAVDPETVLLVANALDATGSGGRAIAMVERQLSVQPPRPDLLNGLAGLYERDGNPAKAKNLRDRAHTVATAH